MKFTKEQIEDRDKIYKYIKFELLHYGEEDKLPTMWMQRLYGAMFGKVFQRGKVEPPIIYPLPVIYATLLYKKSDIIYCLETYKFKDEGHKINTIFSIINNNSYIVKKNMERKIAEDKKAEEMDVNRFVVETQSYKTKSNIKDKFKELL